MLPGPNTRAAVMNAGPNFASPRRVGTDVVVMRKPFLREFLPTVGEHQASRQAPADTTGCSTLYSHGGEPAGCRAPGGCLGADGLPGAVRQRLPGGPGPARPGARCSP